MARKKSRGNVRNVCSVCGREFWSSAKAEFCTDESTCRVKYHNAQMKAERISQALMVDMETFALYVAIVGEHPDHKTAIDTLLMKHGSEVHKDYITLLYSVLHPDRLPAF